jgi:Uncharacterized conserved protein, contains double-stranded beta-helix domain
MIGEIAEKIATLRKQKGYTLKELSDRAGLSISFLSQIENGSSSLAITSLKKIADALGVPIIFFFASNENHTFHVTAAEQKEFQIAGTGNQYVRLSGSFSDRSMEALKIMMPPGSNMGQKFSYVGEEFVYVMEGALQIELEGKLYMVKAGESIHYPSTIPHVWTNPEAEPNRLICVITPAIF